MTQKILPNLTRPRISLRDAHASSSDLVRLDHLYVVVAPDMSASAWRQVPDAARLLLEQANEPHEVASGQLGPETGLSVVRVDANTGAHELMTLARKLLTDSPKRQPARAGLICAGHTKRVRQELARAFASAAAAKAFALPSFKSKPQPAAWPRSLTVFGGIKFDTRRVHAESDGNNLARWLSALPPNMLTAKSYTAAVKSLARKRGWKFEFYDQARLKRLGADAFLAVARGNPHRDAGMVRLRHGAAGRPKLTLVGKGVCFDTGGVNIKTARYMQGMQEDMQGSAVALGSFLALTRLRPKLPLECWLALTENRVGANAYTPTEVIKSANGTTIEVMHSDAEGRMALADTLALAAKRKPALTIDYATLTGACVGALTTRYSGVFCNRAELDKKLVLAGRASGERVWPFPMDADFDSDLDSAIADIKQCSLDSHGDHILAARFLSRFVAECPWAHIDLSSCNRKGGLGHIATDTTGFGVLLTCNLVLDQKVLDTV